MDERKWHLEEDLNGRADQVVYEVRFFMRTEDGVELYETLKTHSPPMLPDRGEFVSFDFLTDENDEEVFRDKQGYVPPEEVASDEKFTRKYTPDFRVCDIDTSYRKCVTEDDRRKTLVSKSVTIEDVTS